MTVHVKTSTESEIRQTANIIADTPWGDPNRVIVQGSHLDSVVARPGHQRQRLRLGLQPRVGDPGHEEAIKTKNKIRFAWWGAEEFNLLGSQFYVDSLSDEEFAKIMANLNFDMIASPNFVRFVYDGDGSDTGTEGPAGSGAIEQMFVDWFDSQGLASEPTAFDGRSDYGPFIDRGAPRRRPLHGRRGRRRRPRRRRSTAASPARRTTAATTRPATRSAT